MSTGNEIKLKKLLDEHIPGTVLLSPWLESYGISYDLQKRYRKSGWIENIGPGAYKRPKENVDWKGALFSLQNQAKMPAYPGALTSLSLLGYSHYLRLGQDIVYLFSPLSKKLPAWFNNFPWENPIEHIHTSFLPDDVGFVTFQTNGFNLKVSSAERAILEFLYLAPNNADLLEGYQILSGLSNLRPKLVSELLISCTSIKVKRLFLYMADKSDHQWVKFLDRSNVILGSGDRSIVKNGTYNPTYKIIIPNELALL